MSMLTAFLLVAAGLVLLAAGGESLVRGAIAAAEQLRVPHVVIGLTVVAMATSLPEMAVSVLAALRGSPDVAVGNVVGSNVFNVAAIVGVSAIFFAPLRFRSPGLRFDVVVMVAAAGALIVFSRDAAFGRNEGAALVLALAAFLVYRVTGVRRSPGTAPSGVPAVDPEDIETNIEVHGTPPGALGKSIAWILLGSAVLTGGAEALVRGAVAMAQHFGVSERVIAITLVSAGTGLPELATAIVAGIRRHAAVSIGNVIGSNIFNSLGILGTVSLVRPPGVAPEIATRDVWWMLGFSLVALWPAFGPGRRVSRWLGAVVLVAYAGYVWSLF